MICSPPTSADQSASGSDGGTVAATGRIAATSSSRAASQPVQAVIAAWVVTATGTACPADAGTPATTCRPAGSPRMRSEEHTSELQSLMRISYAVFCLKKRKQNNETH